jgi:2-alkyl-3-oxoalkanoate reductase
MKIILTGASGFLGGHLLSRFVRENVETMAQSRRPISSVQEGFVRVRGDLNSPEAVDRLTTFMDENTIVIHNAALADNWGPWEIYRESNVLVTQKLIERAFKKKIKKFIFISSPSIFVQPTDQVKIKEADPVPAKMINNYAQSKYQAEQIVKSFSDKGLSTVIVRPQGIVGLEDPHIVPRILKMGKRGKVPRIDGGKSLIDLTWVENVVDAIWAMCLRVDQESTVYNISNGEPAETYELIHTILKRMNYAPKTIELSFQTAWKIASALEAVYSLARIDKEPPITKYSVCVFGKTRTLDISQAQKDLGYRPRVSLAEGMDRIIFKLKSAPPK